MLRRYSEKFWEQNKFYDLEILIKNFLIIKCFSDGNIRNPWAVLRHLNDHMY